MENIYLHGINHRDNWQFSEKEDLEVLEEILASKYILSRELQDGRNKNISRSPHFNGTKYISLCDYDLKPLYADMIVNSYTAYDLFINQLISIIINKEIEVIKPVMVNQFYYTFEKMKIDPQYKDACFSDLPDEVQVKDKISLDHMEGITIPLNYFKHIFNWSENGYDEALKRAIAVLNKIDELLTKYNRKHKIYNLENFQEIKTSDDIEKSLKKAISK